VRIAMVNNFFVPRPSGSVHLTEGLANHLSARGHDVLIITAAHRDAPAEEIRDGYRVVRLPCWAPPKTRLSFNYDIPVTMSPRNLRRIFAILDEFDPDVVHQHGQFFDLTWMSAIWARRRRVPTVLTVHTALVHSDRVAGALLWLGDMALVRPFLAIGRPHVVLIDQFIDSYVRSRYHLPDDRLTHIVVGVDPSRFAGLDRAAARATLGIGDRRMILSVGHVIPLQRDRVALVRSLPYLVERRDDIVVMVVGHVFDDTFLAVADELGVRANLVSTGEVPKDVVPMYVAAADVEGHDFHNFGLGTASLEVMAAGVPVVSVVRADNFPGLELRSWENVVRVPEDDPRALAEAILTLLDDPELAAKVGDGQRRFIVENFSIETVTDQHEQLYRTVMSG
jgi:glycosyltransferase involved in cell wall biosynthesis